MQINCLDIIVIYRKNETILILISLKRYFSHPENQNLTEVFLNSKEAIVIPGPGLHNQAHSL